MVAPLSSTTRRLISDGKLTSSEVGELKTGIRAGTVKKEELKTLSERYGDLFDAGSGKALVELGAAQRMPLQIKESISSILDLPAAAAIFRGEKTISATVNSKDPAAVVFQRALNAIAERTDNPAYALLGAGADGAFGAGSTAALKAFQADHGLAESGVIDQATAFALEGELMSHAAPDIGGVNVKSGRPDGKKIAQAALDLVAKRGKEYGVGGVWKSPNPNVPGNRKPGVTELGAKDRWKCNLFAMDSVFSGGAQPPHYGGKTGSYPIAVDVPGFSRGANAPLTKIGEVWPGKAASPEVARQRIQELMKIARPGDLIIVNHPGDDGSDGGHCRVVTANNFATNGTVDCAQASYDTALVRAEGLEKFTGEEGFFLLRPNALR